MTAVLPDGRRAAPDHVVGFYEHDDDLVAAVTTFLAGALDRDGSAIVFASGEHRERIDRALLEAGWSAEALASDGRYLAMDANETRAAFMRNGELDRPAFDRVVGAAVARVVRRGPLRLFGEMVSLLWQQGDVAGAIALESVWNDLVPEHDLGLYCAYPMASIEGASDLAGAKEICDAHSDVIALHRCNPAAAPVATKVGDRAGEVTGVYLPNPMEIRNARALVRNALTVWGLPGLVDAATLISSELATNAILHARSPFRVTLLRGANAVRISVEDGSSLRPRRLDVPSCEPAGRGVALVAAVSDGWGMRSLGSGKVVWADLVYA